MKLTQNSLPWLIALVSSGIVVWLLLRDVDPADALTAVRDNVVIVTALVGIASLVVATTSFVSNRIVTRKEATLAAWSEWSDRTQHARATLTHRLGARVMTEDQGKALATADAVVTDAHGRELSVVEKKELVNAIILILNGLERLAVGVQHGIYRRDVLTSVGGTIVVRCFERCEPYITQRRSFSAPERRQEKAFLYLEDLTTHIRKKARIDNDRIQALHRG